MEVRDGVICMFRSKHSQLILEMMAQGLLLQQQTFFVHDGGQVVSVLAFYSDDQNSNPAYV